MPLAEVFVPSMIDPMTATEPRVASRTDAAPAEPWALSSSGEVRAPRDAAIPSVDSFAGAILLGQVGLEPSAVARLPSTVHATAFDPLNVVTNML